MNSLRGNFFLVVDDGGFSHFWPEGKGKRVDFSAYENLARLATTFDIQIVLACTMRFLDIRRVSSAPAPHRDTKRLIILLEKHPDRLLVADHGYSHQFAKSYTEFYDYLHDRPLPESEQERHIEQSAAVYRSLGWPTPIIFVPPAHGWQPGTTDRLYAERGVKYLTAVLWIKKPLMFGGQDWWKNWLQPFEPGMQYEQSSPYLKILPRLGLGIPSFSAPVGRSAWWRAYNSVLPTGYLKSMLLHRRIPGPPHNYMAHIGNFAGEKNYRGWNKFLERLVNSKCCLVKNFTESVRVWAGCRKVWETRPGSGS